MVKRELYRVLPFMTVLYHTAHKSLWVSPPLDCSSWKAPDLTAPGAPRWGAHSPATPTARGPPEPPAALLLSTSLSASQLLSLLLLYHLLLLLGISRDQFLIGISCNSPVKCCYYPNFHPVDPTASWYLSQNVPAISKSTGPSLIFYLPRFPLQTSPGPSQLLNAVNTG